MKKEISEYINWCHEKLEKLDSNVPTGHMMTEEVAEIGETKACVMVLRVIVRPAKQCGACCTKKCGMRCTKVRCALHRKVRCTVHRKVWCASHKMCGVHRRAEQN